MEPRRPEGNTLSPLPTHTITSFLGYMHRCFSDFVVSDSPPIPTLPQEHQSNLNDDSRSSAILTGTSTFECHDSIDVMNQQNPPQFTESPSLRRAG